MNRYKYFLVLCVLGVVQAADCEELRYDAKLPTLRPRFCRVEPGLPGNVEEGRLLELLADETTSAWTFGWFAYGERGSRSISVGVAAGRLYLDRNRDQQFQSNELVTTQENSVWTAAVDAEFFSEDNTYEHHKREIVIRMRAGHIEIATAGGMIGTAIIDGKTMQAIRIDRDANGLWFDSADRILLDKNNDGRLHPLSERLACDAVCRIGMKKFAIQSDSVGHRLDFVELAGVGTLQPLVRTQKDAQVNSLSGTLVSRAGVRVAVRSAGGPLVCPVGEYRVEDLAVEIGDSHRSFLFRFATLGGKNYPISIERDQTTEFNLLGEIELTTAQVKQTDDAETKLTFMPMVKTEHGSFLTGSMHGTRSPTQENRLLVELLHKQEVIDQTTTGFS